MKAYLVSSPTFDATAFLNFLREAVPPEDKADPARVLWERTAGAKPAEELVEAAGRVCYMAFGPGMQSPRNNAEYIRHLIRLGHESVLEHAAWTFVISGVSRALTHQLVRHRAGFSFSQLSQQYHEERQAAFVKPTLLERFPDADAAWHRATAAVRESYSTILDELTKLDRKSAPELDKREMSRAIRSAARSVLPNATATTIVATVNARALRHFLIVRGSIPGDEEMRQLAAELCAIVKAEAPAFVRDFDIASFEDGSPVVIHRPILESENERAG